MISVTVLGSTGSIGVNTLDVIARHPDKYRVDALTAYSQVDRLLEQCIQFRPRVAVLVSDTAAGRFRERAKEAGLDIAVLHGEQALAEVAADTNSQVVMAAIVGAAGLVPTLAAVTAGKRVLLANKEPLVMCGHIFLDEAAKSGAELLPIDSEHNAIFQCMPDGYAAGQKPRGIRRILLTGSGGPFRARAREELADVTPEQACAHPNWSMGQKISVDSATLMNKGLELIEACWLFNVGADDVDIVIHPQSVIHSMVEYNDGSVLAQMGNPDMRTPIAHALAWPERIDSGVNQLDLFTVARLDFERPDLDRFPSLRFAYRAAREGGTKPAIMNAANEVAVAAFLEDRIPFTAIFDVIEYVMTGIDAIPADSLGAVLLHDGLARKMASRCIDDRFNNAVCKEQ
ncbi:MAG: 1-deoxy-D-xylulose-5-phosphate reductoisomerase [Gammaproteobacteria bacterium]|nr:1-deoxy-D-xylulose-5-phosphate reductoisomerase [Gammaproteobacteria bacterium]